MTQALGQGQRLKIGHDWWVGAWGWDGVGWVWMGGFLAWVGGRGGRVQPVMTPQPHGGAWGGHPDLCVCFTVHGAGRGTWDLILIR